MKRVGNKRALVIAAAVAASALVSTTEAGFIQTGAGPYSYSDTLNWLDGVVDGSWDPSLTLAANQTVTYAGNTTLGTGLAFRYAGGRTLTLRSDGGDSTLTLGGDVAHMTASNQTVTIGSTSANQKLNVDLGGTIRTISVGGQGTGGDFGRTLVIVNGVSNGGLIVNGGGTGGGRLTLRNSANAFSSIEVGDAELALDGATVNSTVDTVNTVSGALTSRGGASQVTLAAHSTRSTRIEAGSFVRDRGTVLFRGTNLASTGANSTQVLFGTAPTVANGGMSGGDGSNATDAPIIPGAFGDTTANGTGFGSTGGLVTYGATGVRVLGADEYKNAITSGQTQLDNIKLSNSSGAASAVALDAPTTINSLSINVGAAISPITISGSNLTLNSGVVHAVSTSPATTGAEMTIASALDLNGHEGVILYNTVGSSNGTGGAKLLITGSITNADGIILTGKGLVEISGSSLNTYTGLTTVNSGNVRLSKSVQNASVVGDVVVNGGTLQNTGHQIADTSNVTINGGTYILKGGALNSGSGASETFGNLVMNGGSYTAGASGTSAGSSTMGAATLNGGKWDVTKGHSVTMNGPLSLAGGILNLTGSGDAVGGGSLRTSSVALSNIATGEYKPIIIGGATGSGASPKLTISSGLTFTGNSNPNTVTIDAPVATRIGRLEMQGAQTFDIGQGAAATDLAIMASVVDGSSVGALTKAGAGTLLLAGVNSYTGNTTISEGVLALGATGSIATSPRIEITAGASLDTSLQSFVMAGSQTVAFGVDATGAGSAGRLDAAALDITGGSIDFVTVGALDDMAYVIASYGSLTGDAFANAPTVPGYTLDYNYQGNNQIALVNAVPEPGMLALAGLTAGAALMARRRTNRR